MVEEEERKVDRVTRRRRRKPPSRHHIIYQWSKRGNDLLFLSIYRPVYYSEVDQCLPKLSLSLELDPLFFPDPLFYSHLLLRYIQQ